MDEKKTGNEFGAYIREHRLAAKIGLRDAAKVIGISPGYLSDVERGERPALSPKHWESLREAIPSVNFAILAWIYHEMLMEKSGLAEFIDNRRNRDG